MREIVRKIYDLMEKLGEIPVPEELSRNFIELGDAEWLEIEKCLDEHLFQGGRLTSQSEEELASDRYNQLHHRLEVARTVIVPWLATLLELPAAHLLEIGCGTGSGLAALAEQGASVTGIDVCAKSLAVARKRLEKCGLAAEVELVNATEIETHYAGRGFAGIIFFASLEHMTIDERLTSLSSAWKMLKPGGLLVVLHTPNRLWFYDSHSCILPFFDWLPLDLARLYATKSTRGRCRQAFKEIGPGNEAVYRLGRGVSYHEFELSLGDDFYACPHYNMDSYLYQKPINRLRHRLNLFWRHSEYPYEQWIRRQAPRVPDGFFTPEINIALRK